MTVKTLVDKLTAAQCIKYGQFVLKSGQSSSYYVNLRETTLDPHLFQDIVLSIKTKIEDLLNTEELRNHPVALVGVPYGVVPIAAAVAYSCNLAYYPLRKETKDYGYKSDVKPGEDMRYIIIEDVMSSGSSILDAINKLDGKNITDVIVIVNRESGGDDKLKSEHPGIRLHSILRLSDFSNLVKS